MMNATLKKSLIAVTVLALLAGGGWYWNDARKQRTTDNAYVNAAIVQVASRVTGQVVAVHVQEGGFVHAGDDLFDVDPAPYQVALAAAQAKLAEARQGSQANVLGVEAARAALAQSQADLNNARAQAKRTHDLVLAKFVSKQAEDDAQSKLQMAQAAFSEAQSRLGQAQAGVSTVGGATPAVRAAVAAVDAARLDLQHTRVRATQDGWIANITLVPGTTVSPNQPLFALIQKGSFWVDANFKETELPGLHPGQTAEVQLDMLPGKTFPAVVESLGSGTGAAFSLLPAQNATGNWVKVTQRVPVRMRFVGSAASLPFKVGATATVSIKLAS